MSFYNSAEDYRYNLNVFSSSDAKRIWKQSIKDKWNNECAYCGNKDNLTIDHIVPLSRGGHNLSTNVICCCKKCNHSKSHSEWEEWFKQQDFFSEERIKNIKKIINNKTEKNLYTYKKRKNIVY